MNALRKSLVTDSARAGRGDRELSSAEAAEYLGYTVGTLYTMKSAGEIVPDFYVRSRPVYLKSSLDRWRAENTVAVSPEEVAP